MNILGIRVEPKKTTFVIITKSNDEFKLNNIEQIKVPSALDFPDKLKYIRNCVLDIIREYSVSLAGIRVAEANSKNIDTTRLHIEGVIQEAFASSTVDKYFIGRKSSIAAKLSMKPQQLADIINGTKPLDIMHDWDLAKNNNAREAILVAVGATAC